jgi:hypothetical protein
MYGETASEATLQSAQYSTSMNIFIYFYFCQFTIYLTVQEVISKCAISGRLGGGNCPTAVLT